MDSDKKERIEQLDEEITKLRDHAVMRARAGGGSNAVIDTLERVKELELEKEDLINGTDKLASYKQEKRIKEIEYEITHLKSLRDAAVFFKKKQYESEIKALEDELVREQKAAHTR